MSEASPLQFKFILGKAYQALQQRQPLEARRLAYQALRIDPQREEPWLILAAISQPKASKAYLLQALRINPQSVQAQQGLVWAEERLAEESQVRRMVSSRAAAPEEDSTQPIPLPTPSTPPPAKTREKRKPGAWWLFSLLGILLLGLGGVIWLSVPQWIALARSSSAPIPAEVMFKPTLTFTPTSTPTSTPTPTPTPTNTPTPTRTPTKRPTKTPTRTPLPTNPPEAPISADGRWIDIDLSEQRLYAYEDDRLIDSFLVSTGTWQHPTLTGQFHVYVKYLYANMSGPGYYLPNVPYTMYYDRGYGIHGTYWHNNFGTPMSHGCINLRTEDARWLFNWSSVGTLVNIHN